MVLDLEFLDFDSLGESDDSLISEAKFLSECLCFA